MPTVLFLMPTQTYRARAFLRAAEKMRLQVVVGTDRKQALQAFTHDTTLTLDFHNAAKASAAICRFAKRRPLDAIIPVDEDTSVVAALASAALHLPHNAPAAARAAREKHLMRQLLAAAGLPTPDCQVTDIAADPAEVAQGVPFPCVLKPLFLSSSRGVIRADNPEQFEQAFRRITGILAEPEVARRGGELTGKILVEQYLAGEEVALEGILTAGKLQVLAIFDKPDPLTGPFFEETIYVTPSRLPAAVQQKIALTVTQAAAAMGIRHGPVHAELRINPHGVWLIEIAARAIGGLCSQTLRFEPDLSLEEVILQHALGMDIRAIRRQSQAAGVMMIPIPRAGVLQEIRGLEKAQQVANIEDIRITVPLTQKVIPLPEGDRYLGFIFARAETAAAVEEALRQAHRCLQFEIEG